MDFRGFLGTGFGLGRAPFAPGTLGTLLGLPLAWMLDPLWGRTGAALAVALLAVPLARHAERAAARADPGSFVLDEVAGILVTLVAMPRTLLAFGLGFLAFRLFDIGKPWPIRRLERLPRGWGVVVDDLAAGAYAWVVLRAVLAVIPS